MFWDNSDVYYKNLLEFNKTLKSLIIVIKKKGIVKF